MNGDTNFSNTLESQDQKKKQKAGLNAVRPDDYTEQKFKGMAKERNLSQTEMFERLFWDYIKAENDVKKHQALNLEGEINLISKDLNSILLHFKTIADKAQNTVISLKTNAEQTESNLALEVDTLSKKIQELEMRNLELEQANGAFTEIKNGLDKRISELTDTVGTKDTEIKELKETIKEKDKLIKDMEKEISISNKELKSLDITINNLQDEVRSKDTKIKSLELSNNSLTDALNNVEVLKKSELSSIEAKYQLVISDMETKIKSSRDQKDKEIQILKDSLKIEFEADKKMAIADMKLELADMKNKYVETLAELNFIKQELRSENTK
ncbi:MAG: hypothetical protein AB7G87_09145 [Clostridia bacterium]